MSEKIVAIVRDSAMYSPGSLRELSATKGVTMYTGQLIPGADPTVRTHADTLQRIEFEGHTEDEAAAWLAQNGIKGKIQRKKATASSGQKAATITVLKPKAKKKGANKKATKNS